MYCWNPLSIWPSTQFKQKSLYQSPLSQRTRKAPDWLSIETHHLCQCYNHNAYSRGLHAWYFLQVFSSFNLPRKFKYFHTDILPNFFLVFHQYNPLYKLTIPIKDNDASVASYLCPKVHITPQAESSWTGTYPTFHSSPPRLPMKHFAYHHTAY